MQDPDAKELLRILTRLIDVSPGLSEDVWRDVSRVVLKVAYQLESEHARKRKAAA
jgi:hypothetical protein